MENNLHRVIRQGSISEFALISAGYVHWNSYLSSSLPEESSAALAGSAAASKTNKFNNIFFIMQ